MKARNKLTTVCDTTKVQLRYSLLLQMCGLQQGADTVLHGIYESFTSQFLGCIGDGSTSRFRFIEQMSPLPILSPAHLVASFSKSMLFEPDLYIGKRT